MKRILALLLVFVLVVSLVPFRAQAKTGGKLEYPSQHKV